MNQQTNTTYKNSVINDTLKDFAHNAKSKLLEKGVEILESEVSSMKSFLHAQVNQLDGKIDGWVDEIVTKIKTNCAPDAATREKTPTGNYGDISKNATTSTSSSAYGDAFESGVSSQKATDTKSPVIKDYGTKH